MGEKIGLNLRVPLPKSDADFVMRTPLTVFEHDSKKLGYPSLGRVYS